MLCIHTYCVCIRTYQALHSPILHVASGEKILLDSE